LFIFLFIYFIYLLKKFFFLKLLIKIFIYVKLIEYNGSIPIYEFINSYRDSNDAPHPELTDINTIAALEKLKEMKNEIGEGILNY